MRRTLSVALALLLGLTCSAWIPSTYRYLDREKGISFVGAASDNTANGGTCVIDFTTIPLRQNDLVIVYGGGTASASASGGGSGYTSLGTINGGSAGEESNVIVQWKLMGSSPDTSFTSTDPGDTNQACAYVAMAFRGVDTASPIDVETGPTGFLDDSSAALSTTAVTPASADDWVVTYYSASQAAVSATPTFPVPCNTHTVNNSGNDTNDITTGMSACAPNTTSSYSGDSTSEWSITSLPDGGRGQLVIDAAP